MVSSQRVRAQIGLACGFALFAVTLAILFVGSRNEGRDVVRGAGNGSAAKVDSVAQFAGVASISK
jgi:hypothetical protein